MRQPLTSLVLLGLIALMGCQLTNTSARSKPTPVAARPAAAPLVHTIDPQATDPAINDWVEPHLAVLDSPALRQNRLFIFFAGSYGRPQNQRLILDQAALSGYHAIGLRYPNSWTVNDLCDSTGDPACYEAVRTEILTGADRSPLVEVTPTNAILNRLVKLLAYLSATYPDEGWAQFLDAQGAPIWSLISAGGHSQGGGHAAMLGKQYSLARVCMLSSPNDTFKQGSTLVAAPWLAQPGVTLPNAYYGLVSELEGGYEGTATAWASLGLGALGPAVRAESAQPPYAGTHMLTTRLEPARPGEYHGSTAVDRNTPIGADGTPSLAPAWQYLCFPRASSAVSLPTYQLMLPLIQSYISAA